MMNKHKEIARICLDCGTIYRVQLGGQKSGTSPAVWVDNVGKRVIGFCSSRCLVRFNGGKTEETLTYQAFKSWGMNYDQIFPEGYLAPSRRITITHQV